MACTAIDKNLLKQEQEELLAVINANIPQIEQSDRWDVSGKIDWNETGQQATPFGVFIATWGGVGLESGRDDTKIIEALEKISDRIQTTITRITGNSVNCPAKKNESLLCFNSFFLQETVTFLREYRIFIEELAAHDVWKRLYGQESFNIIWIKLPQGFIEEVARLKEKLRNLTDSIRVRIGTLINKGNNCEGDSPPEEEPPPESDEACEKIANALEKLADKDFSCLKEEEFLDGVNHLASLNLENAEEIGELKAEITSLKEDIAAIKKAVGVDDLPLTTFECITDENCKPIVLESIPAIQAWSIQQLDALIGKFPLKITIKDTELDEKGDQSIELEWQNLAELLADLTGLIYVTETQVDATFNATMRNLMETASTKKMMVKQDACMSTLCAWIGHPTTQKKIKIPSTFNPFVKKTADILKSTLIEMVVDVPSEEDSGNFQHVIGHILNIDQICQRFVHRGNPQDLKGSAMNLLTQMLPKKDRPQNDGDGDDDPPLQDDGDDRRGFDEFMLLVQDGFIAEPGMKDTINPYGRKFDRRARITEVGIDGESREDITE